MIENYTITEGTILQAREINNGIATVTVVSGQEYNVPLTSLVSLKEFEKVIERNMKMYIASTQKYPEGLPCVTFHFNKLKLNFLFNLRIRFFKEPRFTNC